MNTSACTCTYEDAWRCAAARSHSPLKKCCCDCHRHEIATPRVRPGGGFLLDTPVARVSPKSQFLQQLEATQLRQRIETAPGKVVAIGSTRKPTKKV